MALQRKIYGGRNEEPDAYDRAPTPFTRVDPDKIMLPPRFSIDKQHFLKPCSNIQHEMKQPTWSLAEAILDQSRGGNAEPLDSTRDDFWQCLDEQTVQLQRLQHATVGAAPQDSP